MLPPDTVPPNDLLGLLLAVCDHLRAHSEYLGVEAGDILDHPLDPTPDDKKAVIEVYVATEAEDLGNAGHPYSPQTEASFLIACKVARISGWRSALFDLHARVRAVLLQDPAFAQDYPIIRIESVFSQNGEGQVETGAAVLTVTFAPYVTDYPPIGGDTFAGGDMVLDAIDPADPNVVEQGPDERAEGRASFNVEP